MGNKCKSIYLKGEREQGFEWQLKIDITTKQREWAGSFYLADKIRRTKKFYLAGAREDGYKWEIIVNISGKDPDWGGYFDLADETSKHKDKRRSNDRNWALRKFPQRWLQQFELHHDWLNGEVLYFLTPAEHLVRDREIRYAVQ